MPPISEKLICHILDGSNCVSYSMVLSDFFNMAELLSNNLEAANSTDNDHTMNAKHKQQDITQIMDWIQGFSTHIPMVSNAKPDWVVDLIDHLNLIIKRQRCFQDFDWALYDHQFRQKAATNPTVQWGTYVGRHTVKFVMLQLQHRTIHSTKAFPSTTLIKKVPICLKWTEDPSEGCPHLNCRYEHVCYHCINIPAITDNHHKAIHCSNKDRRSTKLARITFPKD